MDWKLRQNNTRQQLYRPYIFGEDKVWNSSLYDPYANVDQGLYGNWSENCFDQHNCYDRLAPVKLPVHAADYSKVTMMRNNGVQPTFQGSDNGNEGRWQMYAMFTPNPSNGGNNKRSTSQTHYKRLHFT